MEERTSEDRNQKKRQKKLKKRMWKSLCDRFYEFGEHDIKKPILVFSVIGGSDSFVPISWQTRVFRTALIEAAKSGGETWILYRSVGGGRVSKVVNEAYNHYENIEFMSCQAGMDDPKRHIKLIDLSEEELFSDEWDAVEVEYNDLEMEFERFVSKQEVSLFGPLQEFKITVPVAIIVCEGDLKTIAKISYALKKKLPVIIMKGSGKAADLTLDYIEKKKILRERIRILFGIKLDDKRYNVLEKYLEEIEKHKDLVSVFDLDRDDPFTLSNVVGDALIKCMFKKRTFQKNKNEGNDENGEMGEMEPESTALDLSFTDSALISFENDKNDETISQMFNQGSYWIPKTYISRAEYCKATSLPLHFYFGYQILQVRELEDEIGDVFLFEALMANRSDYVKVLLDRGITLNDDAINEMYLKNVGCTIDSYESYHSPHSMWNLKKIPQAKMLFDNKSIDMTDSAKRMCLNILGYKEVQDPNFCEDDSEFTSVLLWAILLNRKDVAKICWLKCRNFLLTGLICSAILKKLSKNAKDVKELVMSEDLEKHSKMFEEKCISSMNEMYEENEQLAINFLTDRAQVWGICSSPLTFAYENFMYDIIAHRCSQKHMNNQWWNELEPDMGSFLKSTIHNWKNIGKFIKAPRTKFVINYIVFLLVLIAYSIFVLTSVGNKYTTPTTTALQIFVYIWSFGDVVEEFIACIGCDNKNGGSHRKVFSRMNRHMNDFWNVVDLLSYLCIIAAVFFRHLYQDESHVIARNLFALSLLVMYLRFLEVFLIHHKMGPTLMMIKEMLKDLLVFLLIAVFVILGVGIYYHANLWPDHQAMWNGGISNWGIWRIIYYPYWQLYGEFNLDVLSGSDDSDCNVTSIWESDISTNRCPHHDWTVPLISAIFVLFSNLLLVNLVIAMFSYTFAKVKNISEKLWHFQTYTVITDYNERIPSPFNLILRPVNFILYLNKCCKSKVQQSEQHQEESTIRKHREYSRESRAVWSTTRNLYDSDPELNSDW